MAILNRFVLGLLNGQAGQIGVEEYSGLSHSEGLLRGGVSALVLRRFSRVDGGQSGRVMSIRFGAFELDQQNYELRKQGIPVPVPRRVFDTIAFLASNADRVVTKQELIEGPWRGHWVTDAALARVIMHARELLEDDPTNPLLITTVRSRGFRFRLPQQPGALRVQENVHPFFGRLKELAALEDAFASAAAGRGGFFVVSGEPGIGKTALLERFAQQAQTRVAVSWGRAREAGGAPSFWPWSEALRSFCASRARGELRELMKGIGADLARVVPTLAEALPIKGLVDRAEEPGEARFRVFDSVSTFVQRAAASEPLVLVLDDLHAADEPTLSLLSFIVPVLGRSRVLLVGTCRTPDYHDRKALRALVETTSLHAPLEGLALHEIAAWLAQSTAEQELGGVAAEVHRLTSGHPLLVQDVLRTVRAGTLTSTAERLLLRSPPNVPNSLAAGVLKRLARLPGDTRKLLDRAAVLGREFSLITLASAAGETSSEGLAAIEPALREGLVQGSEHSLGSFRFSHDIVRRTLYGELSAATRLELHHEFGKRLATAFASSHLFEIANHLLIAAPVADTDSVVAWALRAVNQANRQMAHEDAVGYATRAKAVLDACGDPTLRRGDVLLALARAQRMCGQLEQADLTLSECFSWSLERDLHEPLVFSIVSRLDLLRERATVVLDFQQQASAARDVVAGPKPLRAQVLAAAAVAHFFQVSPDETRRTFDEAFRLARESGDANALIAVNTACLVANRHAASISETLLTTEELIAAARQMRRFDRLMEALVMRASCFLQLGQGSQFRAAQAEHTRISHALRYPIELWHSTQLDHVSAILDGRFEQAEESARDAVRLGAPQLGPAALGVFGAQLITLALEKPPSDARAAFTEALSIGRDFLAVAPNYPAWTIGTALAELELGDDRAAVEALRFFSGSQLEGLTSDVNRSLCLVHLARMASRLEDRVAAERLLNAMDPLRGLHAANYVMYLGPLNYFSGALWLTLERPAQAKNCFEDAMRDSVQIGSAPWRVWSGFVLAQTLAIEADPATQWRRRELLESSRTLARRLGMGRFLRMAEAAPPAAVTISGLC